MLLEDAIKKAREVKGLSQKAVALSCKMDQAHYSRIENGKTDPSFSVVVRIAKALGMEVYELLKTDQVYKEVSSLDKSVIEKVTLIEQLDKKEKQAFFVMLDALVAKKRLKDSLNAALNKVG
jgi:transcriptional regulator with XRE-family HTH domain